jgi:hypothetical protein
MYILLQDFKGFLDWSLYDFIFLIPLIQNAIKNEACQVIIKWNKILVKCSMKISIKLKLSQ